MNQTIRNVALADATTNQAVGSDPRIGEALQKNGVLQNAILRSASFSIIATDEKGTIRFFNAGAERMLGYTALEVVDTINPGDLHDLDELMARADALSREFATPVKPGFEAMVFKAARGTEDIYELSFIGKDRSRVPAIVSITALYAEPGDQPGDQREIIGYLLIGTSNSVRTRVEVELTNAKVAAEKASFAKADFLVQLSHELRTPLNVILGFAQIMQTAAPPPAPAQKQNLAQILKAGSYLLELCNEIFDMAALDTSAAPLSLEPVDVGEVLLECRDLVALEARKRNVRVTFPQSTSPGHVVADRTRLKQVLLSLLSNAIKYNRPGGTVTVDCSASAPASMRFNIRDTGKGLAPKLLAQLFQPFKRLGQETGEEEGAGIGLFVSKQLVDMMGGKIGVDSVVGTGSVFWFELKTTTAAQLTYPEGESAATTARAVVEEGAAHRTVLYVEDNPANLELVRQLIARRPDLRLVCASNGALGIEAARANRPEVILMDINMPVMNGIDAMKILRDDPSTAHIPIIALTANAMRQDVKEGLESGFFNYMTKPIRVDFFMTALDAALDFSRTTSERGAQTIN